jgi:hypothetical protein
MNKYTRKKKAKHQKYAKTKTKAKARNKAKTKKLYYKGGGRRGRLRELTIIPKGPGKPGTLKITELPEIVEMPSEIEQAQQVAEQTAIDYWKNAKCGFFTSEDISDITGLIRKYSNTLTPTDSATLVTPDKAVKRSIYNILKSLVPKFKQPPFTPYFIKDLMICSNPDKYKYDILACASFLLLGIIAYKMAKDDCPYRLIFKGGKALQLHGIDHDSEDIDVLLIPRRGVRSSGSYNEAKISELAKNIAYLIKRILNNSSIKNYPIEAQLGQLSVLDKEIEIHNVSCSKKVSKPIKNLSIYKVSWTSNNTGFIAMIDIDYKKVDSNAEQFYLTFDKKEHIVPSLQSTVLFEYPTLDLILAEKTHYFNYYTSLNKCAQAFIDLQIPNFNLKFDESRNSQDLFNLLGPNPSIEKAQFNIWYTDFSERRQTHLPKQLEDYINQNQHFLDKFQKSITSINKYKASLLLVEIPPIKTPPVKTPQVKTPPLIQSAEKVESAVKSPLSWANRVTTGVQTTPHSSAKIITSVYGNNFSDSRKKPITDSQAKNSPRYSEKPSTDSQAKKSPRSSANPSK